MRRCFSGALEVWVAPMESTLADPYSGDGVFQERWRKSYFFGFIFGGRGRRFCYPLGFGVAGDLGTLVAAQVVS